MPTALTRLWRRAPLWRASLLVALPATLLTVLYPVWDPRTGWPFTHVSIVHRETPAVPAGDPPMIEPSAYDPGLPLPAPVVPAPHTTVLMRETERHDSLAPFYEAPEYSDGMIEKQDAIAMQESTMRPVFTGTAPNYHHEIPLPPGNWTVISMGPEAATATTPQATGMLLARLVDHKATGFVLIRSSIPGGALAAFLPANPMCGFPQRYARAVLVPPQNGSEECWFIAEATFAGLAWNMTFDPPALQIGLKTMEITNDHIPVVMIGTTYFRSTGRAWTEITYFFDPLSNGVRSGGPTGRWKPDVALSDPALASFVKRLAGWTRQMLPLLHQPGPKPPAAEILTAANRNSPN